MDDKKDIEVKEEVKIEVKEEVKTEVKEEVVKKEENDFSDIFITENDVFDVSVKYYKKDGKIYTDAGTDSDFDISIPTKEIIVTVKHPNQSDCNTISASIPPSHRDIEKMDIRDFLEAELIRFIVLMRKWNVGKKIDRDAILKLNPKLLKALFFKVREVIGMEGII